MFIRTEYDRLLQEVSIVNMNYHAYYATSPTISQLSKITGATEEHILESLEFGNRRPQTVCT
ncbi:MAG TPA: hypothetical protein VFT51_16035 [Bacillales bacterium]|nr:hypothetical protein [Bacillales bacterium]